MKISKLLKGVIPYDGCYYQINEYYFVAIQGFWFLKSVCKRNSAFEIDV